MVAVAARPKLESMRIVTGCKTPEHFVATFYRFCDAMTCFIPCSDTRPVGSALAFSLRLADGTPMLRGTCTVKAAWTTATDSPFKRAGVQLEIQKLTADSELVFEQLLAHKTVVTPRSPVADETAIDHIRRRGDAAVVKISNATPPEPAAPTLRIESPPAAEPPSLGVVTEPTDAHDTDAVIHDPAPAADDSPTPTIEMPPLYKLESRTPGSAFVLPANPLTDVDDDAIDQLFASCTVEAAESDAIEDELAIPSLPSPSASDSRKDIRTVLGVAPLAPVVTRRTDAHPVVPVLHDGTAPLVLPARRPAASMSFRLHAMTARERSVVLIALGAALLVAGFVLAGAYVFG